MVPIPMYNWIAPQKEELRRRVEKNYLLSGINIIFFSLNFQNVNSSVSLRMEDWNILPEGRKIARGWKTNFGR